MRASSSVLSSNALRREVSAAAPSALPKVLHLLPSGDRDAPERAHLQDLFSARDFEHITVTLSRRSAELRPLSCLETITGRRGAQSMPITAPTWGGFSYSRRAAAALKALLAKQAIAPALIQAHGVSVASAARALADDHCVPMVLSLHAVQHDGPLPSRLADAHRIRMALRAADQVFLYPAWVGFEGPARPLHVNKAAMLPCIARNAGESIKPTFASRGFLTICAFDRWQRNGLQDLLWAVAIATKKNPGIRLDIAGSGSSKSVNEIRAVAAQLGIADQIKVLPPLSYDALLTRLPHHLGLILLDAEEPPPMFLVEALFTGVPLLVSHRFDPRRFLSGLAVGVHADLTQVEEVSEALLKLSDDNATYRALIRRQCSELYRRFSSQAFMSAYSDALQRLLTAPHLCTESDA